LGGLPPYLDGTPRPAGAGRGELRGSRNEVDEEVGGLVIRDWTPGTGDVMVRKTYDRSCTVDEATFTENTVLELIDPPSVGGG